ncbi:MAG: serine hydrolase domain-containing protein, partial [Ilumatobacter sp.]
TRLIDELHQGPPRPQAMPAPDEWMSILGTVPLLHQPGEGFTYNTAFDILGVLVARVSGRPFTDHVEDRLLRPLAMFDTGFSSPPGSIDRMTTSYRRVDDTLEIVDGPDGEWSVEPVFASGAGGLLSTAADLLAFQRMLLDGGGEVLPRETVAAMTSDHLDPTIRDTDSVFLDGQSWGYGGGVDIAVRNPWNVIGRFGWVGGTGTSAHVVPSHDSIAILLTQTELGGPADAAVLESFWTVAAEVLGHRP